MRERSMFVGDTDYTGVDLPDIVHHLGQWRDGMADADVYLGNVRVRLAAIKGEDFMVRDGLEYLDYFRDLFRRYRNDFDRLCRELPSGVRQRHVVTLRQLYQSCRMEEKHCVNFKRTHHLDALVDSRRAQMTLAEIYRNTRDDVINMFDVGSIVSRLEALVTDESIDSPSNALELKPNLFGIGLNLNYIWERWGFPQWKRWTIRKG